MFRQIHRNVKYLVNCLDVKQKLGRTLIAQFGFARTKPQLQLLRLLQLQLKVHLHRPLLQQQQNLQHGQQLRLPIWQLQFLLGILIMTNLAWFCHWSSTVSSSFWFLFFWPLFSKDIWTHAAAILREFLYLTSMRKQIANMNISKSKDTNKINNANKKLMIFRISTWTLLMNNNQLCQDLRFGLIEFLKETLDFWLIHWFIAIYEQHFAFQNFLN